MIPIYERFRRFFSEWYIILLIGFVLGALSCQCAHGQAPSDGSGISRSPCIAGWHLGTNEEALRNHNLCVKNKPHKQKLPNDLYSLCRKNAGTVAQCKAEAKWEKGPRLASAENNATNPANTFEFVCDNVSCWTPKKPSEVCDG